MKNSVLAASLAFMMFGAQAQQQARQETLAQQAIPDAPKPQPTLPNLESITPGQGTTSTSSGGTSPGDTTSTPPTAPQASPAPPPAASGIQTGDEAPTNEPALGKGVQAVTTLVQQVNFVDVPFTVKDSKNKLVAGLTARDVRVYENGLLQHISIFTSDPFPLSVALVIDQTMTQDEMTRLNDSFGALQDAFTQYDEIAVFTYNNGTKTVTDFTGAQSPRLTQSIERSKGSGREALMPGGGPLSQTTVINNQNFDPNTAAIRGQTGIEVTPPKEIHALNDAILTAATALTTRPLDRHRVIYVISDGKEYGSKAKLKEVIQYLQRNKIQVDGTLVGDSSIPVVGLLDRFHLPLMMRDDVLPAYTGATGGVFDAEFRTGEIEKSFARIAAEVRNQYTLGYYTHEPFIDGKYRKLEVKVLRPNLTVLAKDGYYPSAMELTPRPATIPAP